MEDAFTSLSSFSLMIPSFPEAPVGARTGLSFLQLPMQFSYILLVVFSQLFLSFQTLITFLNPFTLPSSLISQMTQIISIHLLLVYDPKIRPLSKHCSNFLFSTLPLIYSSVQYEKMKAQLRPPYAPDPCPGPLQCTTIEILLLYLLFHPSLHINNNNLLL